MSIYGELDPVLNSATQYAQNIKREHIVNVNIRAHANQHIIIETLISSRDHVTEQYTINYVKP